MFGFKKNDREQLRSRHAVRRGREALRQWLPGIFLAAIIIASGGLFIWLLTSTNVFVVQAVTVLDAREHTTAAVEQIVERELAAVPLDRNVFLVQTGAIADRIRRELPQVRTVHVARKLPGTIRVVVQEKKPAVLLVSQGNYYFVDETGIPFEEARLETLPGIVLPTVKNDDLEATVVIGAPAIAESFVSFIKHVQDNLPAALNAEVAEIRIPSLAAREVHVLLSSNWQILFDVTREPAGQLDVLQRVISELISPEEQAQIEYIDLRIQDRVYYRSGAGISTRSVDE